MNGKGGNWHENRPPSSDLENGLKLAYQRPAKYVAFGILLTLHALPSNLIFLFIGGGRFAWEREVTEVRVSSLALNNSIQLDTSKSKMQVCW